MLSLFIRNLIFTILQPGIVVGLLPYLILRNRLNFLLENTFKSNNYVGIIIFIIGLLIVFYCIYDFAAKGKGTLSPVDRTKKLVISGLYKYSRNPMYVGVILSLIGEVIFSKSIELLSYALVVFLCFHLFVIFIEEPRLKKDFRERYEKYLLTVPRWV